MKCSEFAELIAQKLDGSLCESEVPLLDRHLADCSRCRAELALQKRILDALSEEVHSGLSVDFTQGVTERLLGGAQTIRRFRRWPYLVPAAALAVVTFLFWLAGEDLVQPLSSVARPLVDAVSGLMVQAYSAANEVLAGIAIELNERASLLQELPQPAFNTLLVSLVALLSTVTGLYKVFAFLRN